MDALARANQIRIQRAQLKRDLKAGRLSIHALLLEPPEYVETAKVFCGAQAPGFVNGVLAAALREIRETSAS